MSALAQTSGRAPASPSAAPPEIRALWVDAFHAGIRSPEEVARLVADAKRAHFNMLFVQVRRRGDALYTQSVEPPLDDPAYDPKFDALAHVIQAAKREGIEVHAWLNAMPIWRDAQPPRDPRHVFNLHGPSKTGEDNWLTASPQGETKFPVGYFLDPGHPAAAAYTVEVFVNIVRRYAVDGIHFDYIRYPETDGLLPRGAAVGYNPVSLARFGRATGRTDTPAPDDPQWSAWRRQQVTQLVRRVYLEVKALRPGIKVSAALIPWGKNASNERDFEDAAPVQRVFQEWHAWLREGLLDLAVPMNYARDHDARVRAWFDGWIEWEKRHKHGRQLAVGIGAYLNAPQNTLAQIQRVRRRAGRHHADGVSFFSYANLFPATPSSAPAANATGANAGTGATPPAPPNRAPGRDRMAFFVAGVPAESGGEPNHPGAFHNPAPIPRMDWLDQPSRGWLAGKVQFDSGDPPDGWVVRLRRRGWFSRTHRTITDGNGFFGFTELKPGRYTVRLHRAGAHKDIRLAVVAGRVTTVDLEQ